MLGSSWHTPPGGRGSVSGDPGGGATLSRFALYVVKTVKAHPIRAHSVRAQLTEATLECSIHSARLRSVGVISGMLGTERTQIAHQG